MVYDLDNSSTIPNELERPMVKRLLEAIQSCGVSFTIRISKKAEGGFEFSSLVGNDKKKLLNQLPSKMLDCQPPAFSKVVQQLWEVCVATSLYCFNPTISLLIFMSGFCIIIFHNKIKKSSYRL